MKVHAHIASKEGKKLSLIELKTFCSEHMPVYMIPDVFSSTRLCPRPRPTRWTTRLRARSQAISDGS